MTPEQQRAILEAAAKACGIELEEGGHFWDMSQDPAVLRPWNPLTDDGDALRLAVNLGLAIRVLEKCVFVESDPETLLGQSQYSELEMYGNSDPYTATRRAIVRTAAEIGKAMK